MKKLLKTMGMTALSTAMVLGSVMGIQQTNANAADKRAEAKAAYQKFMGSDKTVEVDYLNGYNYKAAQSGKFAFKIKTISAKKYIHYLYEDLDNDGTPELLVSNTRKRPTLTENGNVLICTYKDGKVKPVFCVGGLRTGLYKSGKSKLCFGFGGSDTETYVYSKYSANGLKHQGTYKCQTVRKKGNKVVYKYYKNDKKSTKTTFMKAKDNRGKALNI